MRKIEMFTGRKGDLSTGTIIALIIGAILIIAVLIFFTRIGVLDRLRALPIFGDQKNTNIDEIADDEVVGTDSCPVLIGKLDGKPDGAFKARRFIVVGNQITNMYFSNSIDMNGENKIYVLSDSEYQSFINSFPGYSKYLKLEGYNQAGIASLSKKRLYITITANDPNLEDVKKELKDSFIVQENVGGVMICRE